MHDINQTPGWSARPKLTALAATPQILVRVLLLESSESDAALVDRALAMDPDAQYEITRVARIGSALNLIGRQRFDVMVTELYLPDSAGLDTVATLISRDPSVPLVVLTGSVDESLAIQAVQLGAQDYLFKADLKGRTLARCLSYAMERHRVVEALHQLSLVDDLTGLYNRRGLLLLGNRTLAEAARLQRPVLVLFADMDEFKQVNDRWGHAHGDSALRVVAGAFRDTFRGSDIIARIGGDEFCAVGMMGTSLHTTALENRLRARVEAHGATEGLPFSVSVSIGVRILYPGAGALDEALVLADAAMYEDKRRRERGAAS